MRHVPHQWFRPPPLAYRHPPQQPGLVRDLAGGKSVPLTAARLPADGGRGRSGRQVRMRQERTQSEQACAHKAHRQLLRDSGPPSTSRWHGQRRRMRQRLRSCWPCWPCRLSCCMPWARATDTRRRGRRHPAHGLDFPMTAALEPRPCRGEERLMVDPMVWQRPGGWQCCPACRQCFAAGRKGGRRGSAGSQVGPHSTAPPREHGRAPQVALRGDGWPLWVAGWRDR